MYTLPSSRPGTRILVALILLPAISFAQRGGSSSGGSRVRGDPKADWNAVMGANAGGVKLSNRDVENMSPLKLLIDKRKDLKLTDEQLGKLKDLDAQLKQKNEDSFKALDSLRRAAQPPAHEPDDEDRARMMSARRTMTAVVGTIRENYDAALKDALPLLTDEQQKTANEQLEKQRKDADDTLREKLGGSRGGSD